MCVCVYMCAHKLTVVAGTPGLVSIIACDSQYPLLYGRAVDVLHRAGGLEVLFDGLVHHQVFELSELRADVRKPSGAHVGRLAHPAGEERTRGVKVFSFLYIDIIETGSLGAVRVWMRPRVPLG